MPYILYNIYGFIMWVILIVAIIGGLIIIVGLAILAIYLSNSTKDSTNSPSIDPGIYKWVAEQEQKQIDKAGAEGEDLVAKYLGGLAATNNGYIFNNFRFEDEKGFSTEIDHIVITRGGLFVVETKNNKGTIYGKKDDKYWESSKDNSLNDKTFKNPIIQNQGHINHLRRMLGKAIPNIQSIIIFPQANIRHVKYGNVYTLTEAMSYITKLTNEEKYKQLFVENIHNRLQHLLDAYGISKDKHIKNIKKMYH